MAEARADVPWYRSKSWIVIFGIFGLGLLGRLARSDRQEPETRATSVTPASTSEPAPEPGPSLPEQRVADEELQGVLGEYLSKKFERSDRFSLKRLDVSAPVPGKAVVAVSLSGDLGLTTGMMKQTALREVMELLEELSNSRATDGVHLYQVSVYLPGQDKYGAPSEVFALTITLKNSEARKVVWRSMTPDRFVALVRDVGSVSLHPSFQSE
jgi:hypothetical protein